MTSVPAPGGGRIAAAYDVSGPAGPIQKRCVVAEAEGGSAAQAGQVAGLDTSVAHPARVYDYWLGGKDNFAADREASGL